MEAILYKNKKTANTIRFAEKKEDHPLQLYLLHADVEALGNPEVIDVTIAAPKPDAVDGDAVLEALPFGEKTINVVAGGMEVGPSEGDSIIICNAAVMVTVES